MLNVHGAFNIPPQEEVAGDRSHDHAVQGMSLFLEKVEPGNNLLTVLMDSCVVCAVALFC